MPGRRELAGVARETVAIVERGGYTAPSGGSVSLREAVASARAGTILYRPDDLDALLAARAGRAAGPSARVEVTAETTAQAGRRLVDEGADDVLALNFASARRPGGGFLTGATAQEEDLARVSALHACLLTQPLYYRANQAHPSPLYTDHAIYSPNVPFFRDGALRLLEAPFALSIVTMAAPNAGRLGRGDTGARAMVQATLTSRAARILAIAADRGHRTLLLGAWGCGVFRNDPEQVASAFAAWLASGEFRGAFDRVVFAVYDPRPGGPVRAAFRRRFKDD